MTTNVVWKKNRNLYAMLLLDQVINKRIENPFNLMPPDGHLSVLNKYDVVKIKF